MARGCVVGDGLALGGDLRSAVDRAVAQALDPLGGRSPDLACVFLSGSAPDEAADLLLRASERVGARNVLGCTASGVMAAGQAVEDQPGVSVWVASLPSVEVRAFHLEVLRTSEALAVLGMPQRRDDDAVGIVLADPWSFPVDGFVDRSHDALGGLPLAGAVAGGSAYAGGTRLLLDGRVHERGAVGVVLGGDVAVHTLVSQGCRPVGRPMTVTRAAGTTLFELAGRSALQQVKDAVSQLPVGEQSTAVRGLHLGVVLDEYVDDYAAQDFLVREITAADHAAGSITVGDEVQVGSTVQFLLRDAVAAHDDLSEVLQGLRADLGASPLAGALLFSGDARGRSTFGSASHDMLAVHEELGTNRVAGCFASGEIAPRAGRNQVQGFSATVLAFGT